MAESTPSPSTPSWTLPTMSSVKQSADATTPPGALAPKESSSFHSLPSPRIAIHPDAPSAGERPSIASHMSAPAVQQFQSPMRQHRRTPSQHREVKETLNAKSEYTSDDSDGTKLRINQYLIREEIGRGSYGAVHLATDQFGDEYAIKEFSKTRLRKRAQSNILKRPHGLGPDRAGGGPGPRSPWSQHMRQLSNQDAAEAKDALYLIREEIAIMKKLNHPNLVSLIEVLDDPEEDSLWMVLEMCKKGVVMKIGLNEDATPYPEEQCRHWFRDLLMGIEYLHAQGIIHRDIKPDNLLLAEDDCLKIVDFGVSEMFEKPDSMMTAKSAGSPAFLPPELCMARHGNIAGKAADIWSMGVSLYCLKYGKLPFHRDNVLEMYEAIRTEEIPLPPDENPDFVDLLHHLMDKDPATRISMRDLRNHPWVTKSGEDPLLSEEDNCSDLVELPNEIELNHAFTRKMSHMLVVMMAINKFKGLISKSRVGTPELRTPRTPRTLDIPGRIHDAASRVHEASSRIHEAAQIKTPTEPEAPKPEPKTRPRQKSVAEEAAELVAARKAFLASKDKLAQRTMPVDEDKAQDSSQGGPAFLGIGLGIGDGSSVSDAPVDAVSDSPTGIDFNIYDRAFEAEMERIRSEKRGNRRTTYLTRFVKEKEKYIGDDCMVIEAGRNIPALARKAGSAAMRPFGHMVEARDAEGERLREALEVKKTETHDNVQNIKDKSFRFAELVMDTMQSARSKMSGETKASSETKELS